MQYFVLRLPTIVMNSLEILSLVWIILFYFKVFSRGEKFHVINIGYIKEIKIHGQIPSLEENSIANTEEKRFKLCRSGFKQIRSFISRLRGRDAFSKGTEIGKPKFYFFQDLEKYAIKSLSAYKCPTEPEIYIHIKSNNEVDNEPTLLVVHKTNDPCPPRTRVKFEMVRVIDIVEARPTDILSQGRQNIPLIIPALDTDKFSDEQRLQICLHGAQTSPKMNIKFIRNSKTNEKRYYRVIGYFDAPWQKEENIMESFECPTQPKIYISINRRLFSTNVISLWVLIKITDGKRPTVDAEKLKAISGRKSAQAIYQQMRDRYANETIDQFIDSKMQYKICEKIFRDEFVFYPSYIDNFTYDKLKKNHPNLWARFYKDKNSEIDCGKDIIIVNGPESTYIRVSETRESKSEDLFVCITQSEEGFQEHFFSKEYNLNNANDLSNDYIGGRFVFERNPNNNSIILTSIIEELAAELATSNVELLYLERRKKQSSAEAQSDDPLCKLKTFERLRFCTLVSGVSSTPPYELGCAKNLVTFVTEDGEKEANGNQFYEWMIPCYQSTGQLKRSKLFYLSRADDKNTSSSYNDMFVYSSTSKATKFVLEKVYTDPRIGYYLKKT